VLEHRDADVGQHMRHQPRVQVVAADNRNGAGHQPQAQEAQRPPQQADIAGCDGVVDQEFQAERQRRLVGHLNQDGEDEQRGSAPAGRDVSKQMPERGADGDRRVGPGTCRRHVTCLRGVELLP
jgi:hypothetical protein